MKSFIFFFQVWKELTERKTLDSYQYRVMNSLDVLKELNNVISGTLNGMYTTNHNIDDCKAEAQEIIGTDSVIKNIILTFGECSKNIYQKKQILEHDKEL